MKHCPQCSRVEADDSLTFCRADGARLVTDSLASDSTATAILHPAPRGGELPTQLLQHAPSIAVLPLANLSTDPENEYFCDGLAEELLNALAKVEGLKVAARTSAFSFRGRGVNVEEIGRALHVNAVLEGSVRKAGDRLRITVQLVNASDGYQLWSERYDREMQDIFDVQDEITLAVVDALKVRLLGGEKAALLKRYTDDTEAYQLYLKGRYFWNRRTEESLLKGIEHFERAVGVDPNYAPAYAGLADSYTLLGYYSYFSPDDVMPKAEAAARKALQIDDTLAEAHTALAEVKLHYEWDWPSSEQAFKRAIELNPDYAHAHHWYSHFLVAMGRMRESYEESKKAEGLEPLNLIVNAHLGWHYHHAREYDRAIQQCLKTIEMEPNFGVAHFYLEPPYEQKGMYEEAVSEARKAIALLGERPEAVAYLGHAYAISGERVEAEKILRSLLGRAERRYVSPYSIAIIHAGLGDKEEALAWLERAYEVRASWLVYANVDPRFDALRLDSRFKDLMRRVGLPQ